MQDLERRVAASPRASPRAQARFQRTVAPYGMDSPPVEEEAWAQAEAGGAEERGETEPTVEAAGSVDEVFARLRSAATLKERIDAVESWRVR